MRKIIYTAILGTYDLLKEPTIITPDWKYICYTNNKNLKSDNWQIIYANLEEIKQVRRLKIVVPFEYDLSIWIDASIEINCNLDEFVRDYHKGYFTLMKHPHRGCVYQEAEVCIKRRKDNVAVITNQMNTYRQQRYPANNGMVATGILIRVYCDQVIRFCEKWWNEVNIHSRRDQLSFGFVTTLYPIRYTLIPYSILENEFKIYLHNNSKIL